MIASCEGSQVNFHPLSVYMGGSRMPVHQGPRYVRIVGRHLFPHVYHKVDKVKLFSASRRASRAFAMVRLPSNYPCKMYSTVAGGQQRWQAGVRPPTYNSMRVANQAAAQCYTRLLDGMLSHQPSFSSPWPPGEWGSNRP